MNLLHMHMTSNFGVESVLAIGAGVTRQFEVFGLDVCLQVAHGAGFLRTDLAAVVVVGWVSSHHQGQFLLVLVFWQFPWVFQFPVGLGVLVGCSTGWC